MGTRNIEVIAGSLCRAVSMHACSLLEVVILQVMSQIVGSRSRGIWQAAQLAKVDGMVMEQGIGQGQRIKAFHIVSKIAGPW